MCLAWCLAACTLWAQPAHASGPGPSDTLQALVDEAQARQVHLQPMWAALLHVSQGQPTTLDSGFILSLKHFSLDAELRATLAHLYGEGASPDAVCRFPARYAWLRSQLAQAPALPLDRCTELSEFLRRAPAEQVSLVYASENLSQPSSMMGHLFLKVGGRSEQGAWVEHAIAFFTDADTYNLPKLMLDSLVLGMPGHFALSPYEDEVNTYVRKEQRTLWEYELKLDPFTRALMRAHLIELKQTAFTYYFHRYNCATLVKHVLALAAPSVLARSDGVTTPKDVIKLADEAGVVANTTVKTPARWRVRMLAAGMTPGDAQQVRQAVLVGRPQALALPEPPSARGYLRLALGEAYNDERLVRREVNPVDWAAFRQGVQGLQSQSYEGYGVEATASKNPLRSPQDMQASLGLVHRQGRAVLKLGFLPVSHTLADDNETYFSENELRLFDTALEVDPRQGQTRLDHLTVYSVQSYLPHDTFTGGLSGRFRLGLERRVGTSLSDRLTWVVDGGLGLDARPTRDVDVYALMGLGWTWRDQGQMHIAPTVGAIVREVYRMKSIVSLSRKQALGGPSQAVDELAFTQAKGLDAQTTLQLQAVLRRDRSGQRDRVYEWQIKRIF